MRATEEWQKGRVCAGGKGLLQWRWRDIDRDGKEKRERL